MNGFRSSLIVTTKNLRVCFDCTGSRTDRVAGGWKTGECTPASHLQAGNLKVIETHISLLMPNVYGISSIIKHRRQTLL